MPPVERPIPLQYSEHFRGIHPVTILQNPLLQVRHQMLDEQSRRLLVGPHGVEETAIRAGRQRRFAEQLRIKRICEHQHAAEHSYQLLVGFGVVRGQHVERPPDVGRFPFQFVERRRGVADSSETLDSLVRGFSAGEVSE